MGMIKKRLLTNRATVVPLRVVQKNKFEVIDRAEVDGEKWFVIQVEPKVGPWLREQRSEWWYEHMTTQYKYRVLDTFDVHEKLYTLLALKWS
jgi:hypothetical protein